MKHFLMLCTVLGTLGTASVFAQTSQDALTALANRIAEKRAQVEALSSDLDLVKTEYNERLRSFASRQADLETQIQREQLRLTQLERDLADLRSRLGSDRVRLGDAVPLVRRILARTKEHVRQGLPFQVEARLGDLQTLERLLEDQNLDPASLLARVWNQLEAEYRLTGESGLYRQTVRVGGREQMVEVARLGMALLYFRAFDGQVGWARRLRDTWVFEPVTTDEDRKRINDLYEALRKNLREGYFPLPNPFARGDQP